MRAALFLVSLLLAAAAPATAMSEPAGAERQPASRMVEIRSYNLKPGTRDRFHQLFLKEALPMLNRWKVVEAEISETDISKPGQIKPILSAQLDTTRSISSVI